MYIYSSCYWKRISCKQIHFCGALLRHGIPCVPPRDCSRVNVSSVGSAWQTVNFMLPSAHSKFACAGGISNWASDLAVSHLKTWVTGEMPPQLQCPSLLFPLWIITFSVFSAVLTGWGGKYLSSHPHLKRWVCNHAPLNICHISHRSRWKDFLHNVHIWFAFWPPWINSNATWVSESRIWPIVGFWFTYSE